MASGSQSSDHRGSVKDPEHDGRLKENREAGISKGTTEGSKARAEEHGTHSSHSNSSHSGSGSHGSSHSSGSHSGGSHASDNRSGSSHSRAADHDSGSKGSKASQSGGADDLKAREYKDADGKVHHHTREYMEKHKGEAKK